MLLQYALLTAPEPLQAGTTANLTLTISNGGRQFVTVTKIVITLPLGTDAKDLSSSSTFQTSATSGWNLAQSGGSLTLTPASGTGPIGANAVVVTIANVAINAQPGIANISISETAAAGGGSPVLSSTSLPAAKFPVQFSVSDLTVTPTEVPYGGSVSVMWTGTQVEAATYTLDWPDAPTHPVPVANVGPYQANNLTIFPAVFTLTVSLTVPGQDQPLIVQRQATVTQTPKVGISWFGGSKPSVGGAETFELTWDVQLATSLTLELRETPGSIVNVSGLSGCTVAARNKVLILTDAKGKEVGTLTPPSPFPSRLSFRLTASDSTGFETKDTSVAVLTPTIPTFSAHWKFMGDISWQCSLVWATSNTVSAVIAPDLGNVSLSGQQGLGDAPADAYSITVTGYAGLTQTAKVSTKP
jgi:hypothetical protein